MKSLIVYYSKFGHTRTIAEIIAQELEASGAVRTLSADELSEDDLHDVDLMVMGCPTHRMNLPTALRPQLACLPKGSLRGVAVVAFDTSYKMSPLLARFTAAKRLARKLRKLGGQRLVKPETFYVEGRQGPLYEGELERAGSWARTILQGSGHLSS